MLISLVQMEFSKLGVYQSHYWPSVAHMMVLTQLPKVPIVVPFDVPVKRPSVPSIGLHTQDTEQVSFGLSTPYTMPLALLQRTCSR